MQAGDFKTSEYCKQCHTQIHPQWTSSTHSYAYRDPIYQVFLRRVDEASQSRLTQSIATRHPMKGEVRMPTLALAAKTQQTSTSSTMRPISARDSSARKVEIL